MLFPGTEMHMVTFFFICMEVVIMLYLCIYRYSRPYDPTTRLDIFLIAFLIIYNVTGGLLPDPKLPGSFFVQNAVAYGTGFLAPSFFPFYVYKVFDLKKMKFHARYGVFLFLIVPYTSFVIVFYLTDSIDIAKNILIVPVMYAIWVLVSVTIAIRQKYNGYINTSESREEIIVLILCLFPWMGLPFIAYFDINQAIEAVTTNTGFLLLLGLHLKRHVMQIRFEHERLIKSENKLRNWNEHLKLEVERRTRELEQLNKEEKFMINCSQFNLTKREQEIAYMVFAGSTYKTVADDLFISERTVAKHMQNIFDKIRVSNRVELFHKLGA